MKMYHLIHEASIETIPVAEEMQQDLQNLRPNVIISSLKNMVPSLVSFAYHVLVAILILLIGSWVIKAVKKMVGHALQRLNVDLGLSKFLISLINVVMWILVLFIAAERIGVNSASIIAILGSVGLAVGLSLQGSLANLAGGVLILFMHPFRIGDYIVAAQGEGVVKNIGLVYTTLNTVDNRAIIIPNGSLANSALTNVTAKETRGVSVDVGIAYSADIKQAKQVIREACEKNAHVMKEKGITVFVNELAGSAVILEARVTVATSDYWQAKWDLTEEVKYALDAAGIEIPFSQLDVHIDQQEKN